MRISMEPPGAAEHEIRFTASVDVTGAVNAIVLRRVGRFHRRELERYQILKCRLEILVRLRFDGHEFPLRGNTMQWE